MRVQRRALWRCAAAGFSLIVLFSQLPAFPFGTWNVRISTTYSDFVPPDQLPGYVMAPVHEWITTILINKHAFSKSAFDRISDAMSSQDIPTSEAFLNPTNHFDDNKILESMRVVEARKRQLREILPDVATDSRKRDEFYTLFGQILHAMQDFYSHSNYIELTIRDNPVGIRSLNDIPLMDWTRRPAGLKTGYFYWRSLPTDWEKFRQLDVCINGLKSDFPDAKFRNPQDYCGFMDCGWGIMDPKKYKSPADAITNATSSWAELHFYLNKDDWDTPMGQVVHRGSGKNLYEFARHLAEQETSRQWQEIESIIQANYGSQAVRLITAIKTNTNQAIEGGLAEAKGAWRLSSASLTPSQKFQVFGPVLTTSARALLIVPSGTAHNNWQRVMNSVVSGPYAVSSYKTNESAATMQAPEKSGSYEVRVYVYNGAEEASLPFTVTARTQSPAATTTQRLSWSLSKTQVKPQEQYSIGFTPTPAGETLNPVAIVGTGAPHGNYYQTEGFAAQRIQQLRFVAGKSVALTAPVTPGDYHVRVYDTVSKNELTTLPLTVTSNNLAGTSPQPITQRDSQQPPDEPPINPASLPPADCGMMGDESAVPGTGFAGWWATTNGLMRLVRVAPGIVEGPATASQWQRGNETATSLTGAFAVDTGSKYLGRFTMATSQQGRCLTGRFTYDNGETDDIVGYRTVKSSQTYQEIYELTEATAELRRMVGGVLSFEQLDGPDDLTQTFAGRIQQRPPGQGPVQGYPSGSGTRPMQRYPSQGFYANPAPMDPPDETVPEDEAQEPMPTRTSRPGLPRGLPGNLPVTPGQIFDTLRQYIPLD